MAGKSHPSSSTNQTSQYRPDHHRREQEMSKEKDMLSPEDGAHSKKGHSLLSVPSRTSSQRNQSSPTSTGLSGATANDSRNSISEHSKESKGSRLGRRRNGSASSNRSG